MNFKVGDKLQIRTSRESWIEFAKKRNMSLDLLDDTLYEAEYKYNTNKAPLTVIEVRGCFVKFKDAREVIKTYHQDWFTFFAAQKEEENKAYRTTEDGFKTCDDNWKPGALGIF